MMPRPALLPVLRRHPRKSVALGILLAAVALFLWPRGNPTRDAAQALRRQLRAQGFKTEPSDFNLDIGAEGRARMTILTNAGLAGARLPGDLELVLMKPGGTNAARVLWRQARLKGQGSDDLWPDLRNRFTADGPLFDQTQAVLLNGPIRTEPRGRFGLGLLLPHLANIKTLAAALSLRSALRMHDGNWSAAWADQVAVSHLATRWEPEPFEFSQVVRFECVGLAQAAVWEALQHPGWSDDQLRLLQADWESAEFFRALPETAALDRALFLAACSAVLAEPVTNHVPSFGTVLGDIGRQPSSVLWQTKGWLEGRSRFGRFRSQGVYEDELALLRFFSKREQDLIAVMREPDWRSMRGISAVTNQAEFVGSDFGLIASLVNTRRLLSRWAGHGTGLVGLAAESEMRRRLIVAVLALERFHLRRGQYPESLTELVPAFVAAVPIDFADGQPLRYHRLPAGRFQLYSIGLDCIDDAGRQRMDPPNPYLAKMRNKPPPPKTFDLVWPQPASD